MHLSASLKVRFTAWNRQELFILGGRGSFIRSIAMVRL